MTPEDRRARGDRVRQLRKSETFQEVARAVDAHYRDAVFRTKIEESEKRETLFAEYSGFRRLMMLLQSWDDDGKMAVEELERDTRS